MKKDTFIRIVKNLLKHIEDSEKIGNGLKDLIKMRSSIVEDFSDGLDTLFYDDVMVEETIKAIQDELNDKEEFLICWFYEYRAMSIFHNSYMIIKKQNENGEREWTIGSNPDEDEKNLGLLYDAINEYYV